MSTQPEHVPSTSPLLPDPHTSLRRQVVATRCLHCGKDLSDATSASIGLGPNCRKRMGLEGALKRNPKANDLIARAALAAEDGHLREVRGFITQLVQLDSAYQTLATKVQERLFRTRVTFEDRGYYVASTYNQDTVAAFKDLGMFWRPARKAWVAGDDSTLNDALEVLSQAQPGGDVLTPEGLIQPLSTWRV